VRGFLTQSEDGNQNKVPGAGANTEEIKGGHKTLLRVGGPVGRVRRHAKAGEDGTASHQKGCIGTRTTRPKKQRKRQGVRDLGVWLSAGSAMPVVPIQRQEDRNANSASSAIFFLSSVGPRKSSGI